MESIALNSRNNPIRVAWLDDQLPALGVTTPGHLGMTFLPGKKAVGIAGNHDRDLTADVARLRSAFSTDAFVLLVEDHELHAFHTDALPDVMAAHGIHLIRLPIPDADVPPDRGKARAAVRETAARLGRGENVVIACRGGLGRTGMIAACALVEMGASATDAIAAVRAARHGTIQTSSQERYVLDW